MAPGRGSFERVPVAWPRSTAQDFTREMAGDLPPVPSRRPPPRDMPPLPLMVLEALGADVESIYTMRSFGDMVPEGLALVGEAHLLDALRSLLADELVEVESADSIVDAQVHTGPVTGDVPTADSDLQRYWFRVTPAGKRELESAETLLDAYWDAHPAKVARPPGTGQRAVRERPLKAEERATLIALLTHADFEGRDALLAQVEAASVVGYCECGCASVSLAVDPSAPPAHAASSPLPNEGQVLGPDGENVGGVLVFLADSYLSYLEVYDYGERISPFPPLGQLEFTSGPASGIA